jgi:hypothetical protein
VHEVTHARLWRCGIVYEERLRARIEAVCVRREIAFAAKLPNGQEVRERAERALELCAADDNWTDAVFDARHIEGAMEAMRYLGMPNWFIRTLPRLHALGRPLREFRRSWRRAVGSVGCNKPKPHCTDARVSRMAGVDRCNTG